MDWQLPPCSGAGALLASNVHIMSSVGALKWVARSDSSCPAFCQVPGCPWRVHSA